MTKNSVSIETAVATDCCSLLFVGFEGTMLKQNDPKLFSLKTAYQGRETLYICTFKKYQKNESRNCWITKRWKVDPIQLSVQCKGAERKFPLLHYRAQHGCCQCPRHEAG